MHSDDSERPASASPAASDSAAAADPSAASGALAPSGGDSADEVVTSRTRRLGRRRIRRAEPTTPDPKGPLAVLIALGIAAGVVAASAAVPPMPATPVPPPLVEPIDTSVVICPEPGGGDGVQTRSALSIVGDLSGQDRPGATTVAYVGAPDEPVDVVTANGVGLTEPGAGVEVVGEGGRSRALVAIGEGGLAPGLVAGQYALGLDGPRRGLAMTNCPAPAPSWWFVGGGSTVGRTTVMFLVNPESTDAEVDISLAGPDGPISAPSLRGVVVPAGSRTPIRLTRVAPGVSSVVWHVQVRSGRIVAAVQDIDAEGLLPRGIDWIPPSTEPATRVLIPGIIGGQGRRQLIVHAPGESDARVSLRVIAPDGAFTPVELSEVEVPAGVVTAIDIAEALQGAFGTLELSSDVPLVAGVRMRHDGVDATSTQTRQDISFATGAAPVTGITAAAGLPGVRGTAVTIWLTVPRPASSVTPAPVDDTVSVDDTASGDPAVDDTATQVTIRVYPFGEGAVVPEPLVVDVPYDRAVGVLIPRPENAEWFTASISAGTTGVYVAQTSLRRGSRGTLFSGYPLPSMRTTVSIPSAGRALSLSVGS